MCIRDRRWRRGGGRLGPRYRAGLRFAFFRRERRIAAGVAATTQHLHFISDDFSGVAILPGFVLPFSGLNPAFNINRPAFFKVLARDLGQLPEKCDAMPFSPFLFDALAILEGFGGGDADGCLLYTSRCV